MVLIFEGLDRTGKSTQINKIREFFNSLIFLNFHITNLKVSNVQEYSFRYYKNLFLLIEENNTFNFLFDRFHLGEYVYSPLYRNYNGDYVFEFEKMILNREDIFLFVFIDEVNNLNKREDGKSLGSFKEREIQLFKEAFEKSSIKNKLLIDINNKDENEVTNIIREFINEKNSF